LILEVNQQPLDKNWQSCYIIANKRKESIGPPHLPIRLFGTIRSRLMVRCLEDTEFLELAKTR